LSTLAGFIVLRVLILRRQEGNPAIMAVSEAHLLKKYA
jgi:hypothetical protein